MLRLCRRRSPVWLAGILLGCLALVGCGSQTVDFVSNAAFLKKQERELGEVFSPERQREIDTALDALFGTPDAPHMASLGEIDASKVAHPARLAAAAGPVGRDENGRMRGLYREHCAHCHGVSGDGMGPTAVFLNPYPRDYRMGVFKFKSTPKGMKPTHEDLKRILVQGIPGTAMPSFKLLAEDELESLIHYVRYLAIRGETERNLMLYCKTELGEQDRLIDPALRNSTAQESFAKFEEQLETVRGLAAEVAAKWIDADTQSVEVPARPAAWNEPDQLAASVNRGRELFYGAVANCIKCHGESALGDGQTKDFDDWTKELEPADHQALREYLAAGALPPRNIRPRNLRQGVYRGGRRPVDLFWRIRNGIDGTPMPGVLLKAPDAGPEVTGLTVEDVWCLVEYVRSLPYESISRPPEVTTVISRDRL